ncbi:MAG: decaprenyl-phosphate phosphoribosyltransferase [Chloroflexi bacterium]|jgi:4-hydroxybenzoate polyprenyltransferase|nr:decaprenyl-phosphate phosphoribosyltransferase [Chloroflexota bacterium]
MLSAAIKAMRPRQWTKNVVIFAALVFDRQFTPQYLPEILRTLAGFVIFCLLSGVVYIVNDIADIEADRQHPVKRLRPIAAGELPVPAARLLAVLLVLVIFPAAYLLSPAFMLIAAAYLLLNLAYSRWIKHIPILDVISIAMGFVLRVAAGVALIVVARFSPWLYVVTTLGSLYIGFGKRRAELALLADGANSHRRVLDGYSISLLDQYITIVSSTTIIAYSLYTFSAPNLPENHAMMLTIPFVIYGIFRYLYLIQTSARVGAPEDVLLSDRPLQATILLWGICVLVVLYLIPVN